MSSSGGSRRGWMENPRLLFARRLDSLKTWDALICDKTGWQINCVSPDGLQTAYVILKEGKRHLRRKDKTSILRYMLSKKMPLTMNVVENGALGSAPLELQEVDEDERDILYGLDMETLR